MEFTDVRLATTDEHGNTIALETTRGIR
jgi:hypothetical protein